MADQKTTISNSNNNNNNSHDHTLPDHLALSIVGVLGMIGVGKTTLLRNAAEEADVPVFEEYVVQTILRDFIQKRPWMNAFNFQAVMMQSACARLENALSLARARLVPKAAGAPLANSSNELGTDQMACTHAPFTLLAHNLKEGRVVLHERPPIENRIFALANRIVGAMCKQEHQLYTEYVDEMLEMARKSGVPNLNVLLWAPPARTTASMRERGTESEQEYDEDYYLACLHHVYFLDVLAHEREHGYVLVDWRHYGTFESLRRILEQITANHQGHLPSLIEHTNRAVDWEALERATLFRTSDKEIEEKDATTQKINRIVGAEPSREGRGAAANRPTNICLHLHVGRYLEADRATRAYVQNVVLSHLVRSLHSGPTATRLYVHDMADRHRLHDPESRYARDEAYLKNVVPATPNPWAQPENRIPVYVFIVCLTITLLAAYPSIRPGASLLGLALIAYRYMKSFQ